MLTRPREGRATIAFPLIGGVAFGSVLVSPGPAHPAWFVTSLALAVVNVVAQRRLPWARLPRALRAASLVVTPAAIGMLMYSAGPMSGLPPLFLLPLMVAALYGEAWHSATVVSAIAVTLVALNIANSTSALVTSRLVFFWTCMLTVVSVVTHRLRAELTSAAAVAEEDARQSSVMANAARTLTVLHDPDLVIRTAARLAAELASQRGGGRRGAYFRLTDGVLTVLADHDETGTSLAGESIPLNEHPLMRNVVATGIPRCSEVDVDAWDPQVRRFALMLGVTHCALVPIRLSDEVHGVLTAWSRDEPFTEPLFDRLRSLASITELALTSATAHARLAQEATTDGLTGIANRRAFDRALAQASGRRRFAVIVADVDDLKAVNDTHGHAAGDALLRAVARVLVEQVRRGDCAARVGGDEFAILAEDVDATGPAVLSERIHAALERTELATGAPRLSIGVCIAAPGTDPERARRVADEAVYAAKRNARGGTVVRHHAATGRREASERSHSTKVTLAR